MQHSCDQAFKYNDRTSAGTSRRRVYGRDISRHTQFFFDVILAAQFVLERSDFEPLDVTSYTLGAFWNVRVYLRDVILGLFVFERSDLEPLDVRSSIHGCFWNIREPFIRKLL